MRIGVPKEIKNHEDGVSVIPAGVQEFIAHGHSVLVELSAGLPDEVYVAAGTKIAPDAETVFAESDMIVKVKEPQAEECKRLREDQILFTYLHLAPDPAQTRDLMASGATCIAYETVTSPTGGLPLLTPMSSFSAAAWRERTLRRWRWGSVRTSPSSIAPPMCCVASIRNSARL